MGKVEIKLKSSLVSKNPRKDRQPTVFKRSIAKLAEDKQHPGKIIRLYVHINDDYKLFGAFTLNTGGSVSFFPDFFNLDAFDHLTLNKDFITKKAHLTKIEDDGRHKKAFEVEVSKLPTGDYHLVTFGMSDGDLLMDSLAEVKYPDIEYDNEHEEEFLSLLKDAIHTDALMLDFPNTEGAFFIQILIIPKGKSLEAVSIETGFDKFFHLKNPIPKTIHAKKLILETTLKSDFSICFLCFKLEEKLDSSFSFCL